MGLEAVSNLDDLVTTNPVSGDPRSEGDDHLRNLKVAVKAAFPGLAGRSWRAQTKSTNYTVLATDNMTLFNIATTGLTLALTAAATLANGHMFLVHANGFDVTIDPNGAELVNGAATYVVKNGTCVVVLCNGTAFVAFVIHLQGIATAAGDIFYATVAGILTRLAVGTAGQVLQVNAGATAPEWIAAGFTTGDIKLTLKTVADIGWVLMDDKTIGNAASGATGRADADTVTLFTLLWTNTADAQCAVSTGRGGSAAADYAANKTIALPKTLGRALATYGSGSGLTARALALITGVETHVLSTAEMPAHTHTTSASNNAGGFSQGATAASLAGDNSGSTGGGGAHQNMQPTLFLNTMIKL